MEKLISIIIPCYNHEKYMDDCFKSIMAQTYGNLEVIISDDASQDNSFQKIKEWEPVLGRRFSRVIVKRNPVNLGITKNLNSMLELCSGEYIKPLASDDMLYADAAASYMAYAEKTGADIIFSNAAYIGSSFRYADMGKRSLRYFYKKAPVSGRNLTGKLCAGNYIAAAGMFISKKTYEKYGLYNESLSFEDWEFLLRVSVKGNLAYLDRPEAFYRMNEHSFSHFGTGQEEKKRHRRYYAQKKKIVQMYSSYANQEQLAEFFNAELAAAACMDDGVLAGRILGRMRDGELPVSWQNYCRLLLAGLHVYQPLRNAKAACAGFADKPGGSVYAGD